MFLKITGYDKNLYNLKWTQDTVEVYEMTWMNQNGGWDMEKVQRPHNSLRVYDSFYHDGR
jgi:hypothetical protein